MIKTLKDTVELMNSEDYKERFVAEYKQLVIRYRGLENMLYKWDRGELNFNPTCPRSVNAKCQGTRYFAFTTKYIQYAD